MASSQATAAQPLPAGQSEATVAKKNSPIYCHVVSLRGPFQAVQKGTVGSTTWQPRLDDRVSRVGVAVSLSQPLSIRTCDGGAKCVTASLVSLV